MCYAEPGERGSAGGSADLPPAVLVAARLTSTDQLRFRDVVEELSAIARIAESVEDSEILAAACRRVERLLVSLRRQFMTDLGLRDAAGRPNGSAPLAAR